MKHHDFFRLFTIASTLIMVAACGGNSEFQLNCSPTPQITSKPPTVATVGQLYIYNIEARHECGLLPSVCSDVNVLEMPAGAVYSTYPGSITWTPSIAEVNTSVGFRIATVPDECGDSKTQSWNVRVLPDTTPPSITSVYPADGAVDIPLSAGINVSFNEAVNPQTITTASYLVSGPEGPIAGSVQVYQSGNYVTFTPSSYLPDSSTIAVTLTTAVQDLWGNAMAAGYTWSFVTGQAPDVVAPTVPAELTAIRVTGREVDLSWAASVDDVAVAGYMLYRDGANIQSIAGTALSAEDVALSFDTSYCYSISSYDFSGNVSAQSDPVCVTTLDFSAGTVAVWGKVLPTDGGDRSISVPDIMPELSNITAIAASSNELLAIDSDGTIWQIGTVSTQVPDLTDATAVARGLNHSIAITTDGTAWAWGDNTYGQLGNGTTISTTLPVQMQNLDEVTAVAGGVAHTLALKSDGTVWATGANYMGQLGDGTTTWQTVPIQVPDLGDVIAIAASWNDSLALKSDGTVWSWGNSRYGSYPTQVQGLADVIAISRGTGFSLAVDANGTAWAWGVNHVGQLGDGTTTSRGVPAQVTGLADVVAVAAGSSHSLALDADGTVWAWGYNGDGALGDGTRINKTVPVAVLLLDNVKAIAAGQRTSFALK